MFSGTARIEADMEKAAREFGSRGKFVMWHVASSMLVPTEQVRELLAEAGLERLAAGLPKVTEKMAFSRALRAMGEAGLVEDISPAGGEQADRIVYALVRRVKDRAAGVVNYKVGYRVTYYKRGGVPEEIQAACQMDPRTYGAIVNPEEPFVWYADDGNHAGAAAVIRPLIEQYRQCYTARNITANVLRQALFDADGFSWTGEGAPYVLPVGRETVLDQLKAFCARLQEVTNLPTSVRGVSIARMPEEDSEFGGAVLDALMQELAMLNGDLEQLEARAEKVRGKTVDKQDERIAALLAKAQRLSALGSMNLEALNTAATQARQRVAALRSPEAKPEAREERAEAEVVMVPEVTGSDEREERASDLTPSPLAAVTPDRDERDL